MRGGGHDVSPADVLRLPCDLGALVAAVAQAFDRAGLPREGLPRSGERARQAALFLGRLARARIRRVGPQAENFLEHVAGRMAALLAGKTARRAAPLGRREFEDLMQRYPD